MTTETPRVEFWFDFASSYSYVAAMHIEARALAQAVAVVWHPFLLGPIFAEQGWNDSPFNVYPNKGRYMWRDLERLCEAQGLALKRPSQFPRGSVLASRIGCRYIKASWLPAFVRSVFHANFVLDQDIGDPAVIKAALRALELDPEAVIAESTSEEIKAELRLQTGRARALGIFGAPSFWVDGELFWGNERLDEALAWASQGLSRSIPQR